ncbi:MAG: hypothetical protein KBF84_08510, partial [Candidatus Microthrix sp.]|nr:hypothetical protein [Candidatus Microthrix sp.]
PLGVFDGIGRAAATLGASVMPIVARLPISYPLPNVDDLTVRIASLAVGTDRIDAQLEFVDTDE